MCGTRLDRHGGAHHNLWTGLDLVGAGYTTALKVTVSVKCALNWVQPHMQDHSQCPCLRVPPHCCAKTCTSLRLAALISKEENVLVSSWLEAALINWISSVRWISSLRAGARSSCITLVRRPRPLPGEKHHTRHCTAKQHHALKQHTRHCIFQQQHALRHHISHAARLAVQQHSIPASAAVSFSPVPLSAPLR
jgi:hypothetical protein